VTLTGHVLKTRQSDVTDQGYVFSATVIALGNLLVLVLALPLLTGQPDLPTAGRWCWEGTRQAVEILIGLVPARA
jgi:hypothetical protein